MTVASFKSLLEDILELPPGTLADADSRETLKTWSSLADVQILTAIAGELGVEPDPALLEVETVGDMIAILRERSALSD
jgi:acyl carrier protein